MEIPEDRASSGPYAQKKRVRHKINCQIDLLIIGQPTTRTRLAALHQPGWIQYGQDTG
jgi:hypothetical protein